MSIDTTAGIVANQTWRERRTGRAIRIIHTDNLLECYALVELVGTKFVSQTTYYLLANAGFIDITMDYYCWFSQLSKEPMRKTFANRLLFVV